MTELIFVPQNSTPKFVIIDGDTIFHTTKNGCNGMTSQVHRGLDKVVVSDNQYFTQSGYRIVAISTVFDETEEETVVTELFWIEEDSCWGKSVPFLIQELIGKLPVLFN
jgi:hypothetical protein